SATATMLPFVTRLSLPTKDQPSVLIDFGVDAQSLVFESQGDNLQHAKLDFVTVAFDYKGKPVGSQSDTMSTALKPETYANIMKTRLPFQQKLKLPPGKYLLKMGVRDTSNNRIGTVTAQ